jgi:hypothetical protein
MFARFPCIQSQRDCVSKPRVAPRTWGYPRMHTSKIITTPTGLCSPFRNDGMRISYMKRVTGARLSNGVNRGVLCFLSIRHGAGFQPSLCCRNSFLARWTRLAWTVHLVRENFVRLLSLVASIMTLQNATFSLLIHFHFLHLSCFCTNKKVFFRANGAPL